MIDIHSHIIPGIDDGAVDTQMALEMLKASSVSGIRKIVATPHYCNGFADTPYKDVIQLVKKLNSLAKSEEINIEVYHGQEIYYDRNIITYYKEGFIGTINDSSYMLIELPMRTFSKNTINTLYELKLLGIKIILAHPERYHPIIDHPSNINDFIKEGFIFQMNSGSLCGDFGRDVKKTCEILLHNRIYSLIGSDAHDVAYRTTDLSNSMSIIKEKYGEYIDVFNQNGNNIIQDKEVVFEGQIIKKKRAIFDFIKNNH